MSRWAQIDHPIYPLNRLHFISGNSHSTVFPFSHSITPKTSRAIVSRRPCGPNKGSSFPWLKPVSGDRGENMLASKGADIGTGHERRRERGRTAAASGLRYSAFLRWLCRGCGCGCLGSLIVSLVYRGIPLPTAEPDLAVVGLRSIIRDPPAISSRRSSPTRCQACLAPRTRRCA